MGKTTAEDKNTKDDVVARSEVIKEQKSQEDSVAKLALPRTIHLVPMDHVAGFDIRPGFYETNGATAIPGGVNFTVYSHGATSIELLLFRPMEKEPFAVLPFPFFHLP